MLRFFALPADSRLDIQDVMAIPAEARSFSAALEHAWSIYQAIGERLRSEGFPSLVSDEGGWAPQISRNEDALAWINDAIVEGAVPAAIAIDLAATPLFWPGDGFYHLRADDAALAAGDMVELLKSWADRVPLVSIEDGLAQDDWRGWRLLTAEPRSTPAAA